MPLNEANGVPNSMSISCLSGHIQHNSSNLLRLRRADFSAIACAASDRSDPDVEKIKHADLG
jgi:hypothetical protein